MFSSQVEFGFIKGLALRAIRELRVDDPENCHVQLVERRIEGSSTVEELNHNLADECEDDWVEGFVQARSLEILDEMLAGRA